MEPCRGCKNLMYELENIQIAVQSMVESHKEFTENKYRELFRLEEKGTMLVISVDEGERKFFFQYREQDRTWSDTEMTFEEMVQKIKEESK